MPDIDRTVVLEALSALTGAEVKPHTERKGWHTTADELTVDNFLPTVFKTRCKPSRLAGTAASALSEPILPTLLDKLYLGSQSEGPKLSNDEEPETETSALRKELFVDLENFLDPFYDYDFRGGSDSSECSRGGEPYSRPWGWYRFALKVKNKYPDGNAWLGSRGWRSHSSAGEWPVSFHGTSIKGAKAIISSNYRAGENKIYGRGIYSTPDIDEAVVYAKPRFTSKKTGKKYRVIMQNRINPEKREFTDRDGYWLIPVPEGTSAKEEKRIVEESIRPYGILIKEV